MSSAEKIVPLPLPPESAAGPEPLPLRSAWWRHLFEDAPAPQIVCDPAALVVAANRVARDRFNVQAGSPLASTATVPGEVVAAVLAALAAPGAAVPAAAGTHLTPLPGGGLLVGWLAPGSGAMPAEMHLRLARAQRMDTLGGLAAAATHEFNNLLLAVRGNVGLVLSDPQSNDFARTRLKHADLAAERASALSQQLQAFGRLLDGKAQRVEFNALIKSATALARRITRGRITFEPCLCLESTLVMVDSRRIEQAIICVCLNAADVMPPGSVISVVTSTRVAQAGPGAADQPVVCATIDDRGPGIAPEQLGRVFDPFYSTKPPERALGLGLTVARHLVEQAGGVIVVGELPDGGTRVHIRLPLADPIAS